MAFVVPSAAIARSFSSTLVASTVIRRTHKDSDRNRCCSLMLTYQNSPCWQGCKCCYDFVSSPLVAIARSTERGCHGACALIGTNCAAWLALPRVAAGVATATRSAVAPRN